MRHRSAVVLVLAVLVLAGCARRGDRSHEGDEPSTAPESTAVERTGILVVDGRERTYRVHVPAGAAEDARVPLVIGLHGGLGSGEQFASNSELDAVADANGFVAVYPDGIGGALGSDDRRTWNAGYCCGPAQEAEVDDVAFLDALIDELVRSDPVDPDRVFAVGHSNGGMMAYRLACESADRVAGIAVYGASLGVAPCEPSQPVSVLQVHGTADRNHPIGGGTGDRSLARVEFAPAQEGARTLAAADACGMEVESRQGELITTTWTGCDGGARVVFVAIEGASHAWPGGTGAASPLVGPAYGGYDMSAEAWRFFASLPPR